MNKGELDISLIDYDGELPLEFTLPNELIPSVVNQHEYTTDYKCVAYALAGVMQIIAKKYTGEDTKFSTAYIYGRCRKDSCREGKGLFEDTAVSLFVNSGCVPLEAMPDLKEAEECFDYVKAHPELEEIAKPYADMLKGYVDLKAKTKADTLLNIKKALVKYQTPLFGSMDGHAVAFVGYDKNGNILYRDSNGYENLFLLNYTKVKYMYLLVTEEKKMKNFIDVPENHWGKEAIDYCVEKGYVKGTGEDTFSPDKPLTRAEICQILYNYDKATEK